MKDRVVATAGSPLLPVLTVAVCGAVLALAVYGYRAVQEWRRSTTVLIERATADGADLLVTALARDMHGAQALVLANRDAGDYATQSLPDFSNEVSAAFSRFPYPESFFGWRSSDGDVVFFNRANREPPWAMAMPGNRRYPVVLVTNPPLVTALFAEIRRDATERRGYSYFETMIGGIPYQIVARLQYTDRFRDELESVTGFTVNLAWVRERYFSEIVSQVARIAESGVNLEYAVVDDAEHVVAGGTHPGPVATRRFPVRFFDPTTSELSSRDAGASATWGVRVGATDEPAVLWAADWTLPLIWVTALALVLSFFLLARAVRARASLITMRSEFVSTVTHELKTPIATIRAIADALLRGWLSGEGVREYAGLLVQESRRLTRLVDNLLAYARVTDVTELYLVRARVASRADRGLHRKLPPAAHGRPLRRRRGCAPRSSARQGRPDGPASGARQPHRQRDSVLGRSSLDSRRGAPVRVERRDRGERPRSGDPRQRDRGGTAALREGTGYPHQRQRSGPRDRQTRGRTPCRPIRASQRTGRRHARELRRTHLRGLTCRHAY